MGGAVYWRDASGNVYKASAATPLPVSDGGAVQAADMSATAPATWDAGTQTIGITTDVANGVPTLDANGLVQMSQMPIAGLNYHGNWDASTNTPTLTNGTGVAGDFYRVSVAGSQDLGGGVIAFEVGDHVIYEGAVWQQFDPPQTVAWGDITGTVANQADLQAALDLKFTTPTPLIPKVVFGTTLETNVAGLVGYAQDADPDTLAMRQFGGQITTATPEADTDAATKGYVDTYVASAIAGSGTATSLGTPVKHTSTSVNLTAASATVQLVDTTAGDVTLQLPPAATVTAGKMFIIKRITGGASGLDVESGDVNGSLIDGVSSIGISSQYGFRSVVFDGTDWQIIATGGA